MALPPDRKLQGLTSSEMFELEAASIELSSEVRDLC